jgi:hypothetical protein
MMAIALLALALFCSGVKDEPELTPDVGMVFQDRTGAECKVTWVGEAVVYDCVDCCVWWTALDGTGAMYARLSWFRQMVKEAPQP